MPVKSHSFFDIFHDANAQSLLPSVMDPKIFKLKCKPGNELLLVRSVMLKAIDMRNKGEKNRSLHTVFCLLFLTVSQCDKSVLSLLNIHSPPWSVASRVY
jgi:hypothetical protein